MDVECGRLTLAPHIRRTVIAAAEPGRHVSGWAWLLNHKLVSAVAACMLIVLGMAFLATRQGESHCATPYMEIHAEVIGGKDDDYWKKTCLEVRTHNGQKGYIKVEAQWPKQRSVIALHIGRAS